MTGTRSATAADIAKLLDTSDRRLVEDIVATRATKDEVAEAVSMVESELGFDDVRTPAISPRIARVRALLSSRLDKRASNIVRGRD